MNILLINKNPIVSSLFALSAKSIANLQREEIDGSGIIPQGSYDILFVDDECCDHAQLKEFFSIVRAKKRVLFGENRYDIERVDAVIAKPFLPSQIITMLQSKEKVEETIVQEIEALQHQNDRAEQSSDSMILNSDEIDTIKRLLLDSDESPMDSEDDASLEDGLIEHIVDSLGGMKPKKIKKILAGAQIKIKIKFPKER